MLYLWYLVILAAIIIQIIVVVKIFQNEGALKGILGLICGLYAFIWGWMNAGKYNIRNLMMIWTVLIIISIILNIVTGGLYGMSGAGPANVTP